MTEQEEISLMGQPIKITLTGKKTVYKHKITYQKNPDLKSGTYDGYAICDLDSVDCSINDIYIKVNDKVLPLRDYGYFTYPLNDYITKSQQQVSFERICKIFLLLNKKINDLQQQINDKADKESY